MRLLNGMTNVLLQLADFVLLGQQAVGSFALASSKTKIFALAIGTYLDIICEVFNNQAIPRLMDLNSTHFVGMTDYPKMVHGDIEDADLDNIGEFIKSMVGIGALQPDDELEDYIRQVAGLPEKLTSEPYPVRQEPDDEAAALGREPDAQQCD